MNWSFITRPMRRAGWALYTNMPSRLAGLGRKIFRAANGAAITRTADGMVSAHFRGITIEAADTVLTKRIVDALEAGTYELPESLAIAQVIKRGDIIFDIGSGLGFISSLAARAAKNVTVYAFEANPELCEIAKNTHRANAVNVQQFCEVLLDHDGVVPFHIHRDFWASSTIHWVGARIIDVPAVNFRKRVETLKPDVLIVDIEGGERELFSRADLSGVRAIIVEVHPHILGEEAASDVLRGLRALGFDRQMEFAGTGVHVLERGQ